MGKWLLICVLTAFIGSVVFIIDFNNTVHNLHVFDQITSGDLIAFGLILTLISFILLSPVIYLGFLVKSRKMSRLSVNVIVVGLVIIEDFLFYVYVFQGFNDFILCLLAYGVPILIFLNFLYPRNVQLN